jgi:hypothetical protein
MHHPKLTDPPMTFECSEELVYFGEIRPTAYSPGVLIEIEKKDDQWHGVYLVYHYNSPDQDASAQEMVSSKVSFKADEFRDLIVSMRNVFKAVPAEVKFTNEERAAIEVASEIHWHFPKKMIAQFHTPKKAAPRAQRAEASSRPAPTPLTTLSPTTMEHPER